MKRWIIEAHYSYGSPGEIVGKFDSFSEAAMFKLILERGDAYTTEMIKRCGECPMFNPHCQDIKEYIARLSEMHKSKYCKHEPVVDDFDSNSFKYRCTYRKESYDMTSACSYKIREMEVQ